MKIHCIKVSKKKAEAERRKLAARKLLDPNYSPKSEGNFVYFPIVKKIQGSMKSEFKKVLKKPATLEESLKNSGLDPSIIAKSFDMIGDIALVEFPKGASLSDKEAKKIAEAVMKVNPGIKVVAKKTGPISGEYRIRKLQVIAGEKRTETIHNEEGCRYKIDISKSYFSPRLVYERRRIAGLVKDGEQVFVPFAGVGPFAINIAKKHPRSVVWANELNPDAYSMMLENIKLNKTPNVIPVEGDARQVAPKIATAGIGIKDSIKINELENRLIKPVNIVELFLGDRDLEDRLEDIKEVIETLGKKHIRVMIHEPVYLYNGKRQLLTTNDEEITKSTIECYKKLYKLCREYPNVMGFIAHGASVPRSKFNPEIYFRNMRHVSGMLDYIYLENNTNSISKKADIIKVIKTAGIKNFCIDLAHLYITYKNTKEVIEAIKEISSLCNIYFHVSDSDGKKDALDIGKGAIDFKAIIDSGLLNFGILEVTSKDERRGEEILASYDKFVSMLPRKRFDRIIMPIPMSSEKFLDMAFDSIKPGGTIHIYIFEKSEESAVDIIKEYANKVNRKVKILSTRIARDYSSNIVEVVVDFQVLN